MQKIMDAGVDVNERDNLKQTALSRSINANNEVIVKFFLDAGADPNIAASGLPVSQMTRYPKCLKLLIDSGLDRRVFVKAITTALMSTCQYHDDGTTAKLLIKKEPIRLSKTLLGKMP